VSQNNRAAQKLPTIIVVLVGICFSSSCGTNTPTNSVSTQPAAPLDVNAVDFESPELKERFQAFDRAAREACRERDWKHRDYVEGGNFVSAVWALGEGYDSECQLSREPQHQVGTRKIEVDTTIVSGKANSVALTFELVDANPNFWCVFGNYREASEQEVSGAGWGLVMGRFRTSHSGAL